MSISVPDRKTVIRGIPDKETLYLFGINQLAEIISEEAPFYVAYHNHNRRQCWLWDSDSELESNFEYHGRDINDYIVLTYEEVFS